MRATRRMLLSGMVMAAIGSAACHESAGSGSDTGPCSGTPDVAVEEFDPEGGFGNGGLRPMAQSFTPAADTLLGLALYLCEEDENVGPHIVELRADAAGFPSDDVLASAEVDAPLCTWPEFQPCCAAIAPTETAAGSTYWIVLVPNAAADGYTSTLEWATTSVDSYAGGQGVYYTMSGSWEPIESACTTVGPGGDDCYDFAFDSYGE
jgi:hypothetical protein